MHPYSLNRRFEAGDDHIPAAFQARVCREPMVSDGFA